MKGAAAEEQRIEALTVAMTLAPGVYSRNRMFDLFQQSGVVRAKARAAILRGIVKHLARAHAVTLTAEGAERGRVDIVLRYRIPSMRLSRVVELTPVELATLRLLVARAKLGCLPPDDGDGVVVHGALARLLVAGGKTTDLARAAQEVAAPSSE